MEHSGIIRNQSLYTTVSQTEHKICALDGPLPEVIILCDFNLPGVLWDSTVSDTNEHICSLVRLRNFLYLDQMITEPTRKFNTLDLLSYNESIIESIEIDETVISDHNIIHVNTHLKIVDKCDTQVMNPSESVFEQINYSKADWITIVQELSTSNLSNSIQHLNTEDALNLFVKTIGDICIKNAPLKKSKKTSISCFFKHRKALMRRRRRLKMCFNKQSFSRREKIKEQLVNIELELLKSHNDEKTHGKILAIDRIKSEPNYFFKYAKKFSKTSTEVGPLQDSHGDLVNDKKVMSDMLLNQFSSVFTTPSANHVISDVTSFFLF